MGVVLTHRGTEEARERGREGKKKEGSSSQSRTNRAVTMETKCRASSQGPSQLLQLAPHRVALRTVHMLGSLGSAMKKFAYLLLPPTPQLQCLTPPLQASPWALPQAPGALKVSQGWVSSCMGPPGLVDSQQLPSVCPWP